MSMKQLLPLVLCILLFSSKALSVEMNVAFLDPNAAILETEEAKAFEEALQEDLKLELDAAKKLREELAELRERLDKEEDILSKEERQRLVADIRAKNVRFEGQAELLQKVQQQRLEELVERIRPDLVKVLDDLIAIEGYDAVMLMGSQIYYVNPIRNITRKVTAELNELNN